MNLIVRGILLRIGWLLFDALRIRGKRSRGSKYADW